MVHLIQNEISAFTHNFQHTTENSQKQSSLRSVENYVEKLNHYYATNTTFENC